MKTISWLQSKKVILFILLVSLTSVNIRAATFYWVGGPGNWSQFNLHWATTSGGNVFHSHPPTSIDDVIFDANSFFGFMDSVTLDLSTADCRNFDWSGSVGYKSFKGNGTLNIYGSCNLNPTMQWKFYGQICFKSDSTGNQIDFKNLNLWDEYSTWPYLKPDILFEGRGTWDLASDVILDNISPSFPTHGYFYIKNGQLRTNGYSIYCNELVIYGDSDLTADFGTSTIYCARKFERTFSTNILNNISADYSTIQTNMFQSAGTTHYHNVICESTSIDSAIIDSLTCGGTISGINSEIFDCEMHGTLLDAQNTHFHTLNILEDSFPNTLTLISQFICDTLNFPAPGKTISFSDANITVNNHLSISYANFIYSTFRTVLAPSTFNINGDTVCTDNINMTGIVSGGNAALFAGDNSFDAGGNSGWSFTSCSSTIGMESLSNSIPGLRVYPNPITDLAEVRFDNPEHSSYTFSLTDIQSKIVRTIECSDEKFIFRKENLSPGIYLYNVISEKGIILGNGKIIVQ